MKKKVGIQLSDGTFQRLHDAAQGPGLSKSAIVEAALARWFEAGLDADGDPSLSRLDRIDAQLERLGETLKIVSETTALHARYHLTATPPMSEAEQREACLLGQQRFEVLAEQVGKRIGQGQSLIQETLDRLGARTAQSDPPDARPPEGALTQSIEAVTLSEVVGQDLQEFAAAPEGGSNGNFRQLPNSFCQLS
jgi:hypothetical protein